MLDFTLVKRRKLNNSIFFVWLEFFSQQRLLNWLLRGHMTLFLAKISERATLQSNSALLPARVDPSHTEKVFFVGYIPNHLKTGHEVNSSFCFPSRPIINCWIYHRYAVNKWLNNNCALLDGNASVLRDILSGSDNMVFKSRKRKPRQKAGNCTCENIFQSLCKAWELQSSNILSRLFHSCQSLDTQVSQR